MIKFRYKVMKFVIRIYISKDNKLDDKLKRDFNLQRKIKLHKNYKKKLFPSLKYIIEKF